jgi:hypothetical protein
VPVFVLDPRLLGRSERRDTAHRRPRVGPAAGARHLRPLSFVL